MSNEIVPAPNIRATLIPYGNCVESDAALFEVLDSGAGLGQHLAEAEIACNACSQLVACKDNRDTIATVLYQRSDIVAQPFVGGIAVRPEDDEIRKTVIEPFVPFDLAKLPENPALSLQFLRRALRGGKLAIGTRTPKTISTIVDRFIAQLAERDEELCAWAAEPIPVRSRELLKGINDMTVLQFQQADYERVASRKPYQKRYDTERLDPERHYDITRLYLEDVRYLSAHKFSTPTRQALAFSPEEYARLMEEYGFEISLADMHNVLSHSLFNPEKALRERLARLRILREELHGQGISDSHIKQRARWRLPEQGPVTIVRKKKARPMAVSEVFSVYREVDEYGELQGKPTAAKQMIADLYKEHGENPFFPEASIIAFIFSCTLKNAPSRCESLISRAEHLSQTPQGVEVPTATLKRIVARYKDLSTGEELQQAYWLDKIQKKLTASAKRRSERALAFWAIRKIASLYDDCDRASEAADQAQTMVHAGILDIGYSELTLLQDLNYRRQLNDICDSSDGVYLTFSAAMQSLTAQERLAIAADFDLGRLLYGQDINRESIAKLVGETPVEDYVSGLMKRCRQLALDPKRAEGMPTLIMRLSADLDFLDWKKSPRNTNKNALHLETIETVIGGAAMELGMNVELRVDHSGHGNGVSSWLKRTIFNRCKPHHKTMASDVEGAILKGVLVITGDKPENYKIRFNDELVRKADEQEIAALAVLLGIDTFMYGCSVTEILEARTALDIRSYDKRSRELIESIGRDTVLPKQRPSKEALRRQQESLHQLDMAIFVLVRTAAKGFTSEQSNSFKQQFAHYIGRLRNLPENTRINKPLFAKGLARLAEEYQDYLRDSSSANPAVVRIVATLLNNEGGATPQTLLTILSDLSSEYNQQELRSLNMQANKELVGLSQYLAKKETEKNKKAPGR